MGKFNLEDYVLVSDRIAEFYTDYPEGSIRTFIEHLDGPEVIIGAQVFRTIEEAEKGIYTSDFAREVEGKGHVNSTSHIENGATSAIGRALANLGYGTDANRSSRSEMLKVARMEADHEAMEDYIREVGKKLKKDDKITLGDEEHNLKSYIKGNWKEIQERFSLCRVVVDRLEEVTKVPFG